MSNATKCDRCGGFYEQGGNSVCRQGYGVVATDFDLCPDCAESFDAWLERGQMADTSERVTNDGETLHEMAQRIQTLEREIATLKEHRAANVEKLHELTDECAELRKCRDEWKGLAEKYRTDSIAAQAETERYRAKLGDVLDALHEAERAAR